MKTNNDNERWYWEIIFDCPVQHTDLFSLFLFENGSTGNMEITRSEEVVQIKAYFEYEELLPDKVVEALTRELSLVEPLIELVSSEKKEIEDWQSNWKKHFMPIEIGNQFVVLPPWAESDSNRKKIVIQPGQGFGTGYHESTNLALSLLEWVSESHSIQKVVDVGTGSGILAIASLLLNVKEVVAIDNDEEAKNEVITNLELSGLDLENCRLEITEPSGLEFTHPDLVIANIEDYILIKLKDELLRLAGSGGLLLLSGILTERKDELLQQFGTNRRVLKEMVKNEWYGVVLDRVEQA
jgi:ribosomal protein L11 methyltransferase